MTAEAYRLNLLIAIEAANRDGFTHFAAALIQLYKREIGL